VHQTLILQQAALFISAYDLAQSVSPHEKDQVPHKGGPDILVDLPRKAYVHHSASAALLLPDTA
jgi:hypothetical protein